MSSPAPHDPHTATPGRPTPQRITPTQANVKKVALIFEGGAMRASYTAAVVVKLIEQGIVFPFVAGISAGATNTLNYLSSDPWRARASFIDLAADPNFGNWRTFVQGKGLFHAEYIYRQTSGPDGLLPFNMDAFASHPADLAIQALRCSDGATITWGRPDLRTLDEILPRVQASSTMPVVMPPVEIEGDFYVDGALGTSGGIALDAARAAGYTKFFIVLTQERGYTKGPLPAPWFYRRHFRRWPAVADALVTRHLRYNATREEVFALEDSGDAFVFVPDHMPVSNGERDLAKLTQAHALGLEQAEREVPAWREFLGLGPETA